MSIWFRPGFRPNPRYQKASQGGAFPGFPGPAGWPGGTATAGPMPSCSCGVPCRTARWTWGAVRSLSLAHCATARTCWRNRGNGFSEGPLCGDWGSKTQARKGVGVLHREARRIAKDVTELRDSTGGSAATLYQFVNGSIAYFALAAPPLREAGEVTGKPRRRPCRSWRAGESRGGHPHQRHDAGTTRTHGGNCGGSASRSGRSF